MGSSLELITPAVRIAVVSNSAWYLFNFNMNLMRALQAAGYCVVAVAPADAYADRIRAAGVDFDAVPISGSGINPFNELQAVFRLRTLFRRRRVNIVLSSTPKGNIYSALACISVSLPFLPNVSGLGRAFIRRSPITRVVQALYMLTFRRAAHVFFQNPDDMELFVRAGFVRAERSERLPGGGVDLVHFARAPLPSNAQHAPVFLLVGRLLWDKGIGEYVAAARLVRSVFPRATFRLLGFLGSNNPSAIPVEQVEAWVKEGVVEYLGPTDDVRPHVADADCVVLPSYREGVPRSLLEAAAMARPVITTNAPGCRETVIDGETGFLCRIADNADLAAKIVEFIALPASDRLAMGLRGRAFVEQHFAEHWVIDRYLRSIELIRLGFRGVDEKRMGKGTADDSL
jgi:glycosyltransferase involved in cell wall biosynthesis